MDEDKPIINSDRIFAIVMIAAAAVMYSLIGGMQEPYSPGAMSSSTYPRFVLGCIMFISFLLIIRPAGTAVTEESFSLRGATVAILISAYIFLLETVGFFILTPVFLTALPLIAGFRRYTVIAAGVTGVTIGLYIVFIRVLSIPLPAGFLGD